MKRLKALATCCTVAALALLCLAGCSSQESYTPPEKDPAIASPVIAKDGTLRVGLDFNNAPFSAQPSGSSRIVGIDVDIAAALADSLGLKLELVDVGSDPAGALTDGRVDVVMGARSSDTDTTFWMSEAYLQTSVALFAASSSVPVPTASSSPTFAAQTSSTSSWAVMNEFGAETLTSTTDLVSAFDMLNAGTVQYVAADAIIGSYAARTSGDDTAIVALMQKPSGYCVGVLDSNTQLKQVISDTVATMSSNGTIEVIEMKWLGQAPDLSTMPLTAGATATTTQQSSESAAVTGNAVEAEATSETEEGTEQAA